MKHRAFLALSVAAMLTASLSIGALMGCNSNKNENPDDKLPGDDFSGSISEGNKEEETPEQPKDEGDATKTYYISNAEQLKEMKIKGTYVLTADIDMTGQEWTPVGTYTTPFVGSFDGGGFTITGLTVSKATAEVGECISYSYSYGGLFGCTKDATVKNVKLKDVNIAVNSADKYRVVYAGGLCGMSMNTSFTDCEVTSGSIVSSSALFKSYSAGICAFAFGSSFSNCDVSASISVTAASLNSISGGVVAQAGEKTAVINCEVSGNVTATAEDGNVYAGGIAGYLYNSDVTRSSSSSTVLATSTCSDSETGKSGGAYAGGIAGYIGNVGEARCNLTAVYSHGTVTADSADFAAYAGGISAHISYTNVKHSYSVANVTAKSLVSRTFSGGISSYTSTHTAYEGVFFAGTVTVESLNNSAHAGVITAYDANSESEKKTQYTSVAYATEAKTTASVNRISYIQTGFDSKSFIVNGDEYGADELRTRVILVEDLGWSNDDWSFSISEFPELKRS